MDRARTLGAAGEVDEYYHSAAKLYGINELWELPKPLTVSDKPLALPENSLPKMLHDLELSRNVQSQKTQNLK